MDGGKLGVTRGSIPRALTVIERRVQSVPDVLEQTGRQCVHQASDTERSQSHELPKNSKNSLISVASDNAITESFRLEKTLKIIESNCQP